MSNNEILSNDQETVAPELYVDMPNEAYHRAAGISNSGLSLIGQAPAIYYGRRLDPNRPPEKQKPGQLEGNLAHCALLEPDQFDDRYPVGPDVNRNAKEWKAFAAGLRPDQIGIKPDQREVALAQAASVRAIPEVAEALSQPFHAESSAFWVDEETGELCKVRPDTVCTFDGGDLLLDLKTYSSAEPGEFSRQIARKGYHQQDAMYTDGWSKAAGVDVLGFVFIAVETEYPYAASAVMLDEDSKRLGYEQYRANLATYAECRRTNHWPGYSSAIELVRLPGYMLAA